MAQTGAVAAAAGGATVVQHLPIGEVLSLLQEEFPDVTISKIRFLESQGLIQPERTASGYRRFSNADIDRLQWILRQQRDHFLPLKVIRKMLDEGVDRYDPGGPQPTLFSASVEAQADADEAETDDDVAPGDEIAPPATAPRRHSPAHPAVASAPPARPAPQQPAPAGRAPRPAERTPVAGARPGTDPRPRRPTAEPQSPAATDGSDAAATTAEDDADGGSSSARPPHETPADVVAALQEDPRSGATAPARVAPRVTDRPTRRPPVEGEAAESRTSQELCAAAGISTDLLADLERFGLVQADSRGIEREYGPAALEVCRLAARYAELGVEPRHLRMYLVAAEREAGMVEQLAVPLLKQRNPKARENASALASELAELGTDLHRSLLRRELGDDLLP